ncbi:hypothetical protein [Arcobacter ellisii]|uniref:CopG family transcriptional regulator n=1 Tax=Arcobacter ellisii TaxID=913109 RepID=A0ABM6YQ96_9BACT|nr:hypothetical protein [Arcobacter ellisii]AXX96343.1 hypothetical protein AELL_2739 [Arcobacter ellisii]
MGNNKIGRPTSSKDKKKSAKVFVNLTEKQKLNLQIISEKEGLSLSQLCIKALKKSEYI